MAYTQPMTIQKMYLIGICRVNDDGSVSYRKEYVPTYYEFKVGDSVTLGGDTSTSWKVVTKSNEMDIDI